MKEDIEQELAVPPTKKEDPPKRSMPPDKVTRLLSILSLSLAVLSFTLSFVSLYFSALRPAKLQISVSPQVLVNYYRKIGVLCTFTNNGANQIVITSATLKWQNPATDFQLGEVSPTLERWEYKVDESGRRKKEVTGATTYTVFSPIVVKQKDQATAILWFSTASDFQFPQGSQAFTLQALSNSTKVAETAVVINLTKEIIDGLNQNRNHEYSVDVVSQQHQ